MVCLGNICRSPVAEGVLRKLACDKYLQITIDSAGTSGYHIGETPDKRSIENAYKNGVDISKLKARKFDVSDFKKFDKIYVMDTSNLKDVVQLTTKQEEKIKVDLLLNVLHPSQNKPVPDPYYGSEQDFEDVFQLIYTACDKLTDDLLKQIK